MVIKENKIDIVHTHLWGANFWGRVAASKAGVKAIIATEHNVDIWKSWYHFVLDRWLAGKTNRIIAVSNSVKDFYVSKGIRPEKIEVVYNGVEVGNRDRHLRSFGKQRSLGACPFTLAVIGRLVPQKGHRYFLLAFKELLKKHKVKGLIVGSGPLEKELKEFSLSLGLNGSVVFAGLRQDIPRLLQDIDVLVMPSIREGLPIVALEAMAQGVPVVASKVGGTPEAVIDGQTGILVEPNNPKALEKAIARIIEDRELADYFSKNARERVIQDFSVEKMVERTERLYEELL